MAFRWATLLLAPVLIIAIGACAADNTDKIAELESQIDQLQSEPVRLDFVVVEVYRTHRMDDRVTYSIKYQTSPEETELIHAQAEGMCAATVQIGSPLPNSCRGLNP